SLYNKILGSLVGSAIGDAMGAPTEMWNREDRQTSYGYVKALDPSFIDPSPEGLWDFHLPSGTTTDDTRWKFLVGSYVTKQLPSFYQPQGPDPYLFAKHILTTYQNEVRRLKDTPGYDPVDIEGNIRRMAWLQEWAQVAEPFAAKDLEGYTNALHRFYGGELLCAGMLYAPAIALPYPGHPEKAYQASYRLGIFDQGYARDITGLTSALVSASLPYEATPESIMEVFRRVDPNDYFRRRLFGRVAFRTYQEAQRINQRAKEIAECPEGKIALPIINGDSLRTCQLEYAFNRLDQQNQDAPAHAQEILLVAVTAILYSDFDFQSSMEFITNYGRDNDTSGAVAGAILGAYHGFDELPGSLKQQVLETNRINLGIDLEVLAATITDNIKRAAELQFL
ncbi:MAG: ADP-ribosylglycohydrolase family protein, partial [Cyclobacteriaceae bacterium]